MNYAALKNELTTDPQKLGYANHPADPQTIAGLMNALNVASHQPIPITTVSLWAAQTGVRSKLQDLSAASGTALRDAALSIIDAMGGGAQVLDIGNPAVTNMLGAFVAGGVIKQSDADALMALGALYISRAQQVVGSPVTSEDIQTAWRQ